MKYSWLARQIQRWNCFMGEHPANESKYVRSNKSIGRLHHYYQCTRCREEFVVKYFFKPWER